MDRSESWLVRDWWVCTKCDGGIASVDTEMGRILELLRQHVGENPSHLGTPTFMTVYPRREHVRAVRDGGDAF